MASRVPACSSPRDHTPRQVPVAGLEEVSSQGQRQGPGCPDGSIGQSRPGGWASSLEAVQRRVPLARPMLWGVRGRGAGFRAGTRVYVKKAMCCTISTSSNLRAFLRDDFKCDCQAALV